MKDKDLVRLLKKNEWMVVRINGSHHVLQKIAQSNSEGDGAEIALLSKGG